MHERRRRDEGKEGEKRGGEEEEERESERRSELRTLKEFLFLFQQKTIFCFVTYLCVFFFSSLNRDNFWMCPSDLEATGIRMWYVSKTFLSSSSFPPPSTPFPLLSSCSSSFPFLSSPFSSFLSLPYLFSYVLCITRHHEQKKGDLVIVPPLVPHTVINQVLFLFFLPPAFILLFLSLSLCAPVPQLHKESFTRTHLPLCRPLTPAITL